MSPQNKSDLSLLLSNQMIGFVNAQKSLSLTIEKNEQENNSMKKGTIHWSEQFNEQENSTNKRTN